MKKDRLEILGQITVFLKLLSQHDLFDIIIGRTKDFPEYVESLSEEQRDDLFHKLAYAIEDVEHTIIECSLLASQGDEY